MRTWLAVLLWAASALAQAEIYRFGLIGDVPYSAYERHQLPYMLDEIADQQVDFIAHIGDIKHGSARCDDSLFADRHELFNSVRVPFVFVPGDNEWTDCERLSNGAYDPLERLDALRRLFWADGFSLGRKKLALEQQPGTYPEHARFRLGPVLFVTLNIPGGNNNSGWAPTPSPEFMARNPVVLSWLKDSFALARREKLAGIVLLFQADPAFKHFAQGFAHRGYRDFLEALRTETLNFPGQIVAVHGDSHISRIDRPLRDASGKTIANFTRVETFGYPLMGWTRGIIDTDSPTLFRFETHPWTSH
ncbi:MAG: metallophosphoesterase [Bacteroidota bacterium]